MANALCHTDVYTLEGQDPEGLFPCILGHEVRSSLFAFHMGNCTDDVFLNRQARSSNPSAPVLSLSFPAIT
jgi:hypothetical protein